MEAKEAESRGDNSRAITLYLQAVANAPLEEQAWQRLMVLHRKQKDYTSELKVINLALKTYETHAREAQKQ